MYCNSHVRHVEIVTAWPQQWRESRTEQVGAGENQLAGAIAPGCPMDVASSRVFVQVCIWTGPFNLRVRFPSHARKFQKVGSTLGHWAAGPEQGGDSKSYIGVGFSESLGPGKTGPGPGEWPE